jgi:hypothetical protein
LNCYTPLCLSKRGRVVAETKGIPPFVDASCRREPDLEHKYPSITSLCRPGKLIPRLKKGDKVVYVTKKSTYGADVHGWRLTAILEVIDVLKNHEQAQEWYKKKILPLPSNCMVKGNKPIPQEKSGLCGCSSGNYEEAELEYQRRAEKHPEFAVTKKIKTELKNPYTITDSVMKKILKRIPLLRTPPKIKEEEFNKLYTFMNKGKL